MACASINVADAAFGAGMGDDPASRYATGSRVESMQVQSLCRTCTGHKQREADFGRPSCLVAWNQNGQQEVPPLHSPLTVQK